MEVTSSRIRGAEASLIGLAIAFFTLAGSQGDPRPVATYGLILALPLVMLTTALTRRPWIAAAFLVVLGIVIRAADTAAPGSDVLIVTEDALDRLLDGGNPYGREYSITDNPFAYPPGNLLYYLPSHLLGDVSDMEIWAAATVLSGLAWVAWLIRSDGPVAALGIYAAAPPLVALATDGSNDTSAGALLFSGVLLLLLSQRFASDGLLISSALVMGAALAFKQYTLVFWPFMIAYLAGQSWDITLKFGTRVWPPRPAWLVYAGLSAGLAAVLSAPFFLWSPVAFIEDLLAWSSPNVHPVDGWNVWAFLETWLDLDAEETLGGALVVIDIGLLVGATIAGLRAGITTPHRALLFGSAAWFTVMLFARWTTFAYFAGVAPVVLLIPFANRLVQAPEDEMVEKKQTAAGPGG